MKCGLRDAMDLMCAQRYFYWNLRRKKCVITVQVVVIPCILPNSYRGSRMIALSSYLRLKVRLLLLIALTLNVGVVWAQTSNAPMSGSQVRIAQDLESIRVAEQKHLPEVTSRDFVGTTRIGIPCCNRIPESGRGLQQGPASAEDCTISQSRVCLNTRRPCFALPDLRPFGRRRESQKASSQGASGVGQPDRDCG